MNPIHHVRTRLRRALATLALLCAAMPAAAQMPAPAVSSPHPIHVGGYASIIVSPGAGMNGDSINIAGAAASVLLSGTLLSRLSYFSEVEAASRSYQNWTGRREDHGVVIDRLYVEYAFSDALRLRVGRFLTPVGQWNEIHADPLTWTALRPLTTYYPFAKSTTGIMAAGELTIAGRDAGYAVYYSPVDWSREIDEENSFVWALGSRFAIEVAPGLTLGTSLAEVRVSHPYDPDDTTLAGGVVVAGGREEDTHSRGLLGADVAWNTGRLNLLSEAVFLSRSGSGPDVHGVFLQAAVRTLPRFYVVARTEYYDPVATRIMRIQTLGLAFRPNRHWTFKLDRQFADHPSRGVRTGWFVSASALF